MVYSGKKTMTDVAQAPAPMTRFACTEGVPLPIGTEVLPDAVFDILFGPQQDDAPLPCYALLDGCKIDGLPEILETSGLAHRCLFQGDAREELGDVAPWLVALTPNAPLVLQLLTRADPEDPMPWHMWQDEPAVFLRTPLNLTDLWSHLRRFTRIRAEDDTWLYYRFWEPSFGPDDVLPRAGNSSILTQWLFPRSSTPLRVIRPDATRKTLEGMIPTAPDLQTRSPAAVLTQRDRDVMTDLARLRHDRALQAHLVEISPTFGAQSQDAQWDWVTRALDRGETAGLRQAEALRNYVEAALLLGAWPDDDPEMQKILSDPTLHERDKARLVRQAAKKRHNSG